MFHNCVMLGTSHINLPVCILDRATSPVQFNAGISIRLDLDPEKLLQLKNSYAQIKIQSNANARDSTTLTLDQLE